MGWETRNGGLYYYRKRKRGGRVISEYVGAGFLAELEADDAEDRQARRLEQREALRLEQAAAAEQDKPLDELAGLVEQLTLAALLASGYHQHKGQWRRHGKKRACGPE